MEQTELQINNVDFALSLNLDKEQKNYCNRYKNYLSYRVNAMKKKKIFSLIFFFMKRKYKEFGSLKTFLGDIANIIK